MDLRTLALNMLERSPRVKNNPNAQNYINVIRNNDSETGEQIAMNLCKTYGVSPQEATQQARKFFHI